MKKLFAFGLMLALSTTIGIASSKDDPQPPSKTPLLSSPPHLSKSSGTPSDSAQFSNDYNTMYTTPKYESLQNPIFDEYGYLKTKKLVSPQTITNEHGTYELKGTTGFEQTEKVRYVRVSMRSSVQQTGPTLDQKNKALENTITIHFTGHGVENTSVSNPYDNTKSIFELKEVIETERGIPALMQRWVAKKKKEDTTFFMLMDDKTLKDYNLEPGADIYNVLKLSGKKDLSSSSSASNSSSSSTTTPSGSMNTEEKAG